jgi:hypothetical protein
MKFLSPQLQSSKQHKQRLRMILWIGIGVLHLVRFAVATWSPHVHPQHPQQPLSSWQEQQHHVYPEDDSWRGGSTAVQSPPPRTERDVHTYHYDDNELQQQSPLEEEPFQPPKVHLKHVSMALRLTSEWNRRLSEGINKMKHWGRGRRFTAFHHEQQQQQQLEYQNRDYETYSDPYGDLPVNVHPSRAWHPPIPASRANTGDDEELTVFHAKTPIPQKDVTNTDFKVTPRGVNHWGPDLQEMLQSVVSELQLTDEGVEIPLAMIYLDRACSVETLRSNNVAACPFCTPRTVHRLSLAALWMAMEAVHGSSGAQRMKEALLPRNSDEPSSSSPLMDLSEDELQQMVGWMRDALGDFGLMVTVDQMKQWSQSWESIFSAKGQAQRLQHRQQHQASLKAPTAEN